MRDDKRWFTQAKGDAHQALRTQIDELLPMEHPRIQQMQEIMRLYRSRKEKIHITTPDGRTSRNTLRSVTKTIHSRLIGLKPVPFYCPEGGDAELRERLELLNTAVAGLFLSSGFEEEHASLWCLHGVLLGVGFLKAYARGSKVCIDRVYPWEVLMDPLDSYYGNPTCMYQLRWVDKPVLLQMFPGKRSYEAIGNAIGDRPHWAFWANQLKDPVRVVEAWHLPDEDGEGGRHIIATSAGTLLDEEYSYPDFPIIPFKYADAEEGYWPDGVGHNLLSRQREINKITDAIRETIRRLGWPRVFVQDGSQVSEAQLDNRIGAIINYKGTPPVVAPAPPLTREAVGYLADVVASCYEDEGVSQMSAYAQKPGGLNSGRALRIYADQMDGRQREVGEKWTSARTRFGAALIRAQREAAKADPKALISFTSIKERETTSIVWKDVDVPDEKLQLIAQPVSSLPGTPAARAALLEELYNSGSGVITLDEYRDGIDLPDVAALTGDAKAPRRTIELILDGIVQTGEYTPPEPFFPMKQARLMGVQRYCREYNNGMAPAILALLRRWCMDCMDQEQRMAAEEQMAMQRAQQAQMALNQPPPNPGAGAPPMEPPMAPPVDQMMPDGQGVM